MKLLKSIIRWHVGQWNRFKEEPFQTVVVWFLFLVLLWCLPNGDGALEGLAQFLAAIFGLMSVVFLTEIFRCRAGEEVRKKKWDMAADFVFGVVFLMLYLRIGFEGILPGLWPLYFVVLPVAGSLTHAVLTTRADRIESEIKAGQETE